MKSFTRFLLLTIAFFGSSVGLNAQVSLYSFTESVEPYVPITGGTVVSSTTTSTLDDTPITGITLPFTITYNGLPQSVISINPNGFIYFSSVSSFSTTPVSMVANSISAYASDIIGRQFVTASMTAGNPVITVTAGSTGGMQVGDAVFGNGIPPGATIVSLTATTVTMSLPASSSGTGRNFRAANGSIRYQTIGSAPNRKFIVQWTNFSRYSTNAPSDRLNFQIILEETTNIIRTSYNVTYVHVDHTIQAGLAGATNADFNHRTGNFNTTILAPANSSTVNSQASAFPTIGRTFSWTPPPFPTLTFSSITPSVNSCTSTDPRQVTVDASIISGSLSSVVLNYSFNGVAQTPITMTNTGGTTYAATIPSASPLNATVTWDVLATSSFNTTASYVGTAYQDQILLGVSAIANNSISPVCSGSTSNLSISFTSLQASALYNTPSVGDPTNDEDLGSVVITQGATTILSNTTAGGSLVGTIGTASGTPGSFSNFTAFGPYAMTAGSTYNFSLTSITQGGNWGNSMAIFIDYNRDGDFADAGEAAYLPTTTVTGPHVESGNFTIPATALNGLTRMRVVCLEALITGITSTNSWGEYEDYMLNISSPNTGGGFAPAITSVAWSSSTAALGTGNPYTINPTDTDSYSALVTSLGCTVTSNTTSVTALVLPSAVTATNSSQCGTQVPTAAVISTAGASGTGSMFWYSAPTGGTPVQTPPQTPIPATSCAYTFNLTDAYGDGWNGATMQILNGTTVVATIGSTFTTGSTATETVTLQSGTTYTLFWNAAGGYPEEVGVAIVDPAAVTIYTMAPVFPNPNVNTTLTTIIADCSAAPPSGVTNGVGYTTFQTAVSATTTFYVSELGTNGCYSTPTPVVVTVSNPDPIVFTAGANPSICIGDSFNTTASSANTNYTYTYDLASYTGSGVSAVVSGAVLSTTPTAAGVYSFTVTGTDGICTAVQTMPLTVNELPVITSATATPTTACHNAVVDLVASSIVSGPQTLPTGYCTTNNFGGGFIDQVTFEAINNNSTTSNPTVTPYYTNYNLTATVQPGQTYPLTIVNGTSSTIISVWIDYNRDGVLAATEWQQVATAAAAGATVTINVTVPSSAQMGLTKMRIRTRLSGFSNGPGDACTSLGSGETEDYLINIQSQPAVPYSYTWNSTPVVNTMVGTTVVTNTTAVPTTQSWTVTATEAATGCINTMTTAPVTIQPAFLAPVATNSAHCGVQVPTASVADPNNFTTPTFNWYATPTSTTALQATTANTFASTVSTTTTLYVTTTNPSTGCQSDQTPVVITVAPAPALTLSSSTATNCSALPTSLVTLTDGLASYDNFTWTNTSTVTGTAASGYTFNPANATPNAAAITTTYELTAVQTTGQLCQNTATVVVTTNSLPLITSTVANPTAVCSGGTVNLTAESSTLTSVTAVPGPASTGANTTFSYPTPFGNFWWGAKQQFLYTAAELSAAGFAAGTINSLAFDVTTPSTTTLTDYTISMKNTTVTALTTTFETGLTQVYYNAAYTPSALNGFANNTINLTPFNWDGTSNVVIEICFNNTDWTSNAVATWTTAFAGAANYYNADASGVCATVTGGTITNNRPMIQFTGTTGTNYTPTLAWSWPALNQNGTTASTVVSNPGTTNITETYTVEATNPITGCSVTNTTAPVTIWALPTINAGNDILVCSNNATEQVTVTATGAGATGSYAWSGPVSGVQNGVAFTASATGTFSVIGTDGNGCVNYDTLLLTYSTVPPANAGADQGICIGETATFNATGLAPYNWTMNDYTNSGLTGAVNNSSVIVVTPAQPGTYTYQVNVSNGDGCTNDDQAVLTVYALPLVNAGVDQTICNASPVILAGSGALSYVWNNGVTDATPFFPSATATYNVVGTDIHGCQNQDQVTVSVLPQPIVQGGLDQTICAGTPIILNATTTSATPTPVTGFQWSNNVTNNTQYVPTNTGVLTVTATGANGCTNQDQILVTVLALPTVNAGQDITVCAGLSATLNASGAISYAWNNGVTQGVPFYPNATQTYTVVGTGSNGCTNNDQVIVTVSTGPTVNLSAPQTVCANAPATLSAAVQNGLGGYWTTTNGTGIISPNVTNGTVTYTPNANDPVVVNLTYVATNACGSASQNTSVTVLPIPVVNAGPDFAVCQGTSATLTATGNGFLTWTTPNVTNGIAFVPTATATYNVVATGFNNCTNSDQVTVTVLALPDVNAGADQTICSGESVTLNGQGAVSYSWTGGVTNGIAFAPSTTATYTVIGTGINGCESSDQVSVVVNATPVATVSVVDDITLAASPAGMNYQWVNCASGTDAPNGSTANFTAIANGSYAVIVTSAQGCSDQSDCVTIDAVGLDQINNIEMSVQPNPTAGELTVTMPTELSAQAQVFDAQGKLVIDNSNVSNGTILNLSNMTTGVYMVRITAADSVQTFRVVKQ